MKSGGHGLHALGSTLAVAVLGLVCFAPAADAAGASWSFEPSSWDFGVRLPEAGPSPPKAFTLTNTGEVELSPGLFSIAGEGGAGFELAGNDCAALSPGASCRINVTFDPVSPGLKRGSLEVYAWGAAVSPAVAQLSGTGAGPAVVLTPSTLSFEPLQVGEGPSPPRTATVANDGQLDLTISSLSIEPTVVVNVPGASQEQFRIAGGTCAPGLVVPPEGSCDVEVTFSPSVPGSATANLRIVDNAPGSPQTVILQGQGIAAPFHWQPPPPPLEPRTLILRHPPRHTASHTAAFRFKGETGAVSFECKLDSRRLERCVSPVRYSHLRAGGHYFAVRALDASGHRTRDATQFRWRIEPADRAAAR